MSREADEFAFEESNVEYRCVIVDELQQIYFECQ